MPSSRVGGERVPKDTYTRRLLRFNDVLDLLNFLFVPAENPKRVDISSISSDGNVTPLWLVARRSHFVLDKLTKGYRCSLSNIFLGTLVVSTVQNASSSVATRPIEEAGVGTLVGGVRRAMSEYIGRAQGNFYSPFIA